MLITPQGSRTLGNKQYELSNHLGNVLAVITDEKLWADTLNGYIASVTSATDYEPFGLALDGRSLSGEKYRYGFNGKEDDGDFGNRQLIQDYGFRLYNPAIGKFLSVDPLFQSYPWNSVYAFAEGDVIRSIDLDGLEKWFVYTQNRFQEINQEGPMDKLDYAAILKEYGTNQLYIRVPYKRIVNHGSGLIDYIKTLPEKNYGDPEPKTVKQNIDASTQVMNPGGLCYCNTLGRLNQYFTSIGKEPPVSTSFDKRGSIIHNVSYDLSASTGLNQYSDIEPFIGYGVGGALLYNNLGSAVSNDDVWAGKLKEGAIIQGWYDEASLTLLKRNLINGSFQSGHSLIFEQYTYNSDGQITGFKGYDYNGKDTRHVNSANSFRLTLGVNLTEEVERYSYQKVLMRMPIPNMVTEKMLKKTIISIK